MAVFTTAALLAMTAASTGMQVAGVIRQGKQEQEAQEYNASAARQQAEAYRRNIPIIEQQKIAVATQAKLEENKITREKRATISRQKVLYGKAGVQLTGSPLAVMVDTSSQYELDMAIGRYNTDLDLYNLDIDAYNVEVQARQAESQGRYYQYKGKLARNEGYFKAGQTLLTSASNFGQSYGGTMPKATPIQGGVGGRTIQTSQFGTTWSPY